MLSPLTYAFSGKVRFLLGCLLLIGCGMWLRQNDLLSRDSVEQVGSAFSAGVQQGDAASLAAEAESVAVKPMKSLSLPLIGSLLSSYNAGMAGLVLIALGLFRGWKMSLFALPAAAIMVLGASFGIPAFSSWESVHVGSLAAGLLVAAVGLVLGRTRDG
jgi:hypothetical protein